MSTQTERLTSALAGHYRVERELGAGGMATVYLAEDLKHHRKVAVKVLRDDIAASVGAPRFLREIEIAAHLQHPNILPLLDSGEAEGFLYMVMPFVEGASLRNRLSKEGELPVGEAVRLLVEIVDALAHAHAHGVVHRDIKPDNVMLSGRHALVTDFGVARAVSEATGQLAMTTAGVALGTPAYMAPEQAMADPHIDQRADLYAVGVAAYELLTGAPPFTGMTPQQVLAAHVTQAAEPVSKRRPAIPAALENAVMKCLAKRPADRWQSADELLAVLEPLATPSGGTEPTAARLPAVSPPVSKRPRIVAGAVIVGAIAVALAAWKWAPRLFGGGADGSASPLTIGNATQLTSEEGLEIHPAISPDGKFVAYAAGEATGMRIYIRPVTGGRTITLSEDSSAIEFQPRWSPDGTQILYMTPSAALVASALGGSARRVASATDRVSNVSGGRVRGINGAAWSPDGRRIVVARGGTLSIVSLAGAEEKQLSTSRYEYHSCDWSPDGKWIACVSGNGESVVPSATFGNIAPSAIVLAPADGKTPIEIAGRTALNQSPVWSPDGKRLFFVSNRQGPRDIYAVEIAADGKAGDPVRVTTGLGALSIAFSGEGKRLVYTTYVSRANIWSLPIPAGAPLDLAAARPVTTGNQTIESMRVSRDGKWLLYDSNLHGNADIFRVPIAGGAPERLTTDPADDFAPDLSADGRELAYHSWRTGTRDIFVQPLGGGSPQQVTVTPSQESYPVWSPDGRALAFFDQFVENGVIRGLFVVRRDSSGRWRSPRALRDNAGQMSWSPDGKLIAFDRVGTVELIPSDSGAVRVVYAPAGQADPHAEKVEISADGRTIYFKSHDAEGRASLWSVPFSGGRPKLLVRFDDASRPSIRPDFAVGAGRFFFTIEDRQSDIWVAEVTKR